MYVRIHWSEVVQDSRESRTALVPAHIDPETGVMSWEDHHGRELDVVIGPEAYDILLYAHGMSSIPGDIQALNQGGLLDWSTSLIEQASPTSSTATPTSGTPASTSS